jgi:hypothetical protein
MSLTSFTHECLAIRVAAGAGFQIPVTVTLFGVEPQISASRKAGRLSSAPERRAERETDNGALPRPRGPRRRGGQEGRRAGLDEDGVGARTTAPQGGPSCHHLNCILKIQAEVVFFTANNQVLRIQDSHWRIN